MRKNNAISMQKNLIAHKLRRFAFALAFVSAFAFASVSALAFS
jgi:hypothetical protein